MLGRAEGAASSTSASLRPATWAEILQREFDRIAAEWARTAAGAAPPALAFDASLSLAELEATVADWGAAHSRDLLATVEALERASRHGPLYSPRHAAPFERHLRAVKALDDE